MQAHIDQQLGGHIGNLLYRAREDAKYKVTGLSTYIAPVWGFKIGTVSHQICGMELGGCLIDDLKKNPDDLNSMVQRFSDYVVVLGLEEAVEIRGIVRRSISTFEFMESRLKPYAQVKEEMDEIRKWRRQHLREITNYVNGLSLDELRELEFEYE
jgi:hypothetical protein